ncbi:hypothetical protein EI94DRAFT_461222 [Lactarius quietus]|nr:hypothetical protein EI94DRAFT_461222 [Lactarius quietus]
MGTRHPCPCLPSPLACTLPVQRPVSCGVHTKEGRCAGEAGGEWRHCSSRGRGRTNPCMPRLACKGWGEAQPAEERRGLSGGHGEVGWAVSSSHAFCLCATGRGGVGHGAAGGVQGCVQRSNTVSQDAMIQSRFNLPMFTVQRVRLQARMTSKGQPLQRTLCSQDWSTGQTSQVLNTSRDVSCNDE